MQNSLPLFGPKGSLIDHHLPLKRINKRVCTGHRSTWRPPIPASGLAIALQPSRAFLESMPSNHQWARPFSRLSAAPGRLPDPARIHIPPGVFMYSGQLSHALGEYSMKHEKTAFLPSTMQVRPRTERLPNKVLSQHKLPYGPLFSRFAPSTSGCHP
jgi:hypothetical protein